MTMSGVAVVRVHRVTVAKLTRSKYMYIRCRKLTRSKRLNFPGRCRRYFSKFSHLLEKGLPIGTKAGTKAALLASGTSVPKSFDVPARCAPPKIIVNRTS